MCQRDHYKKRAYRGSRDVQYPWFEGTGVEEGGIR
jgi:hypothetical protein